MTAFETTLRTEVTEALRTLAAARDAGHDYEVHLHVARLKDLLDMATRHGIDTSGWVRAAELESALSSRAAHELAGS